LAVGHGHDHDDHDHDDHDDHDDHEDDHGHGHGGKGGMDMNMQAVFLHYLGDAISSLFVMAAGLLIHYYPEATWTLYVDPASGLLIVLLIVGSTVPLIKNCSTILLQQAPPEVDCTDLHNELEKVDGVKGIHDLHVWQLVDDVPIASVHLSVWDCDIRTYEKVVARCKKVLHKFGIHSSTVQPEFVPIGSSTATPEMCASNCAANCKEDWCCKNEYMMTQIVDFDNY